MSINTSVCTWKIPRSNKDWDRLCYVVSSFPQLRHPMHQNRCFLRHTQLVQRDMTLTVAGVGIINNRHKVQVMKQMTS